MLEFQCAVAARERDEPLFATASQVRRWLLIEVRGAWGRDAVANTDLARYVSRAWQAHLRRNGIRCIAIRRDFERGDHRLIRMYYVESGQGRVRGATWRRDVATLHAAVDAAARLPSAVEFERWVTHPDPLVLVCTNGRHDPCCATFGRPLVRELRQSPRADGVWECSHIGGDRFAANVVILPEGLYFGRCDPGVAGTLLDAYDRGEIHLDRYRGRSTWGFTEQAAEYFARTELQLTAIDAVDDVRLVAGTSPLVFDLDVELNGEPRTVAVTLQRESAPLGVGLTCTGPAGQTVPSYRLVSVDAAPRSSG